MTVSDDGTAVVYDTVDGDIRRAATEWPAPTRRRAAADRRALRTALQERATDLGEPALDRVLLATIDLPLAIVRRHLQAGSRAATPAEVRLLVEQTARVILGI